MIAEAASGADVLTGAGATFPFPLYQKWFAAFGKKFPEVLIRYRAIGLGIGIEALSKHEVDFAACDFPLSGERLAGSPTGYPAITVVTSRWAGSAAFWATPA
jgi:phosphate transport system substrate-binding protein